MSRAAPEPTVERMLRDILREYELTAKHTGKTRPDPRILKAVARIPRHEFVPEESRAYAYEDGPVPIGFGQTVSQPFIVALMTELLEPDEDDAILEVGTGSGYQTAVLAELVKKVYSVEIIGELAHRARERLARLGYGNVEIRTGDGYYGWPEHAPYDGVLVTAAAPAIPRPLIRQLKAGGRLVIPVGNPLGYQMLKVVRGDQEGNTRVRDILGVAFVPLIGDGAGTCLKEDKGDS